MKKTTVFLIIGVFLTLFSFAMSKRGTNDMADANSESMGNSSMNFSTDDNGSDSVSSGTFLPNTGPFTTGNGPGTGDLAPRGNAIDSSTSTDNTTNTMGTMDDASGAGDPISSDKGPARTGINSGSSMDDGSSTGGTVTPTGSATR